ncbi:hypothetical protein EXS57_01870 [Candidatus Kaiserbacteria bacterium]|nr:hypothetical protein [Candidatus Kaiserbacteria bacterium]
MRKTILMVLYVILGAFPLHITQASVPAVTVLTYTPNPVLVGGSAQVSFACSDTNYSHLWLDGANLDEGFYSSKSNINTGSLTTGAHSVLLYCFDAAGASAHRSIALTCSRPDETLVNGVCERLRVPKYDNTTGIDWNFNIPDIHTLEFTVVIDNDPGPNSDIYLQLYEGCIDQQLGIDCAIRGNYKYFGLQTTGKALFAKFGPSNRIANDSSDVRVAPGSTVIAVDKTGGEGAGASLWRNLGSSLSPGTYTVKISRADYDGIGDWFNYYVTLPGGLEQYVGAIRFLRANPTVPASLKDGSGSWTEFWDNNDADIVDRTNLPYPVPDWHVRVSVKANGTVVPSKATSWYGAEDLPNNHNADIYAESAGGLVDMVIGHSSTRVHPAGVLWDFTPTGTWTAPTCPTACGSLASTPPYTCVGGNGLCSINSPATLSCNATIACVSVAPDLTAGAITPSPSSAVVGQTVSFSGTVSNIGAVAASKTPGFPNTFQMLKVDPISSTQITTVGGQVVKVNTASLLRLAASPLISSLAAGASFSPPVSGSRIFNSPGTYVINLCANVNIDWNRNDSVSDPNSSNDCGPWKLITICAVGRTWNGTSCVVTPGGIWTPPTCPTACGIAASNPPYTCVGGNGSCTTNSPATLSCGATTACAGIPTGIWTPPTCPIACGIAASNPPYTCVGGNGSCTTNSPATLSCGARPVCVGTTLDLTTMPSPSPSTGSTRPDLAATVVTVSPSTIAVGGVASFSGQVFNISTAVGVPAGAVFSNTFQVVRIDPLPSIQDTSLTEIAEVGGTLVKIKPGSLVRVAANALTSSAAANSSFNISGIHTFNTVGTYAVNLCANINTSWNLNNSISESNMNNNCGGWQLVTVTPAGGTAVRPDLIATTTTISPSFSTVGGTVSFSGTISNISTTTAASAASAFSNTFQILKISSPTTPHTSSVSIQSNEGQVKAVLASLVRFSATPTIPSLAANTAFSPRVSSTRTFTTFGTYLINLCANINTAWNTNASLDEANFSNNCDVWQPITILKLTGNERPFSMKIAAPDLGPPDTSYTFYSTDPEDGNLRYQIDWDNNDSIDQEFPSTTSYVPSNTPINIAKNWKSLGAKTFRARAVDFFGATSTWATQTVTLRCDPFTTWNNSDTCVKDVSINVFTTASTSIGTATSTELISGRILGGGTIACFIDGVPATLGSFGDIRKNSGAFSTPTTFTLTCKNNIGPDVSRSAAVTIDKAPIEGVCGTLHNSCAAGTTQGIGETASTYNWVCAGAYGGKNVACSETKTSSSTFGNIDKRGIVTTELVNSTCGAHHYECTDTGTSGSASETIKTYNWTCMSTNGDVSHCSESKESSSSGGGTLGNTTFAVAASLLLSSAATGAFGGFDIAGLIVTCSYPPFVPLCNPIDDAGVVTSFATDVSWYFFDLFIKLKSLLLPPVGWLAVPIGVPLLFPGYALFPGEQALGYVSPLTPVGGYYIPSFYYTTAPAVPCLPVPPSITIVPPTTFTPALCCQLSMCIPVIPSLGTVTPFTGAKPTSFF